MFGRIDIKIFNVNGIKNMALVKKISLLFIALTLQPVFPQNNTAQLLEMKSNLNTIKTNKFEILQSRNNRTKKKTGLAILYSLLLPGMGELYADNYSLGQYFTITDAATWGVVAGYSIYGNNKEDDYKAYAKTYAGVNLNNKDSKYFATIGAYENINEYNTEKELYRQFDETYEVEKYNWNWQNNTQRKEYRALWKSSEAAYNNVRFAVGALIVNRIVSAIVAARSVSAYNKREENNVTWNINFSTQQIPTLPSGLVLNIRKRF